MGVSNRTSNNIRLAVTTQKVVNAKNSTEAQTAEDLRAAIYDVPMLTGSTWKINLKNKRDNTYEYDVAEYDFNDRDAVIKQIEKLIKTNLEDELSSKDANLLQDIKVSLDNDVYFTPPRDKDYHPNYVEEGFEAVYKQFGNGNFTLSYRNVGPIARGKFEVKGVDDKMDKLSVNLQKIPGGVDINGKEAFYVREPGDFKNFGAADKPYVESQIDIKELSVSAYAMNHFSDGYGWTDEEIDDNNKKMSEEMQQWSDALTEHGGKFSFSREQILSAFRNNRGNFQKVKGKAELAIDALDEKHLNKLIMMILKEHTPFEPKRQYSWDKDVPKGFAVKRIP